MKQKIYKKRYKFFFPNIESIIENKIIKRNFF
nr:MAG TPA: hypothetical protein [Caudoviricetes sp.]